MTTFFRTAFQRSYPNITGLVCGLMASLVFCGPAYAQDQSACIQLKYIVLPQLETEWVNAMERATNASASILKMREIWAGHGSPPE